MSKLSILLLPLALLTLPPALADTAEPPDPYLWLEEIEGDKALAWVEERNRQSLGVLENLPDYQSLYERNLDIYNADERIAYPALRGDYVYNFWRDEDNPRGLWRRAANADFLDGDGEPGWQVLLDLDALAESEDEDWVWSDAQCLAPEFTRCIVSLSRGGADATVAREFDLDSREFVDDGFALPEAKNAIGWIDIDHVYVGTDFGPGSLTDSGYPRIAKRWRRGTPLAAATEIYAGESSDIWNAAYRVRDGERHHDVLRKAPSFFTAHYFLIGRNDELTRLELPDDAVLHTIAQGHLVVELKSDWQADKRHAFTQGSLLALPVERFVRGKRDFQVLVEPSDGTAIETVARAGSGFVVSHLDNVTNRLERFELDGKRWRGRTVDGPELGSIGIVSSQAETDDLYFVYEGFLNPDTLWHAAAGVSTPVRSLPEFFDADGMQVQQNFAVSADGTRIPYFLVLPSGFEPGGDTPTLLYGYGGFEVSLTP
ncbi:MAG: S9 family peptidase, partial [Pseudomonadota bacterium]